MNEIRHIAEGDKSYVIKTDGGRYLIELYEGNSLVETKEFNEHTLRIVENYGKDWIDK